MRLPIPIIQPIPGEDDAVLKETYTASFPISKQETASVTIRPGFRFSASIPRFFWRVVGHPLQGEFLPASLVHDALYQSEYTTRLIADKAFLHLLRNQGVGKSKAYTMYAAVRSCGWWLWPHSCYAKNRARDYVSIKFMPK